MVPHISGHERQQENLQAMLQGAVPHALHFSGPHGIGKRLVALETLKAWLCRNNVSQPCGSCNSCRTFDARSHQDFYLVEPNDKGTILIGNKDNPEYGSVRWLLERLSKHSVSGKSGVLIDGMDRAGEGAQNALLKILEEPPGGTLMIILSGNRNAVLQTIRSRSQELFFQALSVETIYSLLADFTDDPVIRREAALFSSGSMEQALVIVNTGCMEDIYKTCGDITRTFQHGSLVSMDILEGVKSTGSEEYLDILIEVYHHMMVAVARKETPRLPEEICINDIDNITQVIRILQRVRAGLSRNLNIRTMLKGLLYRGTPGAMEGQV